MPQIPTLPGLVVLELVYGCYSKKQIAAVQTLIKHLPVVWPHPASCQAATAEYPTRKLSHNLGPIDALIAALAIENGAMASLLGILSLVWMHWKMARQQNETAQKFNQYVEQKTSTSLSRRMLLIADVPPFPPFGAPSGALVSDTPCAVLEAHLTRGRLLALARKASRLDRDHAPELTDV